MTTKMSKSFTIAALALIASACAQTGARSAPTAYVPAGRAAQPGAWNGSDHAVVASEGVPAGRDAQPWSGPAAHSDGPRAYAYGIPAGRAAQPGGWIERVQ